MQTLKVYLRNMGRKKSVSRVKTSFSRRQSYHFLFPITMSFSSKDRKITSSRFLGCSTLWRISENGYQFPLHSLYRILPTLLFFMPSLFTNPMSRTGVPALQTAPSSWKPVSSDWTPNALGELHSHFYLHTTLFLCSFWGCMPGIIQVLQLPSLKWLPFFRGNSLLSAPA